MKIGTRLPGFAGDIGFDGYCAWQEAVFMCLNASERHVG